MAPWPPKPRAASGPIGRPSVSGPRPSRPASSRSPTPARAAGNSGCNGASDAGLCRAKTGDTGWDSAGSAARPRGRSPEAASAARARLILRGVAGWDTLAWFASPVGLTGSDSRAVACWSLLRGNALARAAAQWSSGARPELAGLSVGSLHRRPRAAAGRIRAKPPGWGGGAPCLRGLGAGLSPPSGPGAGLSAPLLLRPAGDGLSAPLLLRPAGAGLSAPLLLCPAGAGLSPSL
mmetsp:Transcript_11280/g.24798  ORF Transcript_11280/g.24798 Transcript_11280/m.24798 type:complete len:235 (-) Transcript_11280:144-848(-)